VPLQALPKALGTKAKRHLEVLFDWALPACLRFLRKELLEVSPTEDAGLARGAMRIIEACLDDFRKGVPFFRALRSLLGLCPIPKIL
jgi:dynein heavy chain